jgi:hypothetical protein
MDGLHNPITNAGEAKMEALNKDVDMTEGCEDLYPVSYTPAVYIVTIDLFDHKDLFSNNLLKHSRSILFFKLFTHIFQLSVKYEPYQHSQRNRFPRTSPFRQRFYSFPS